MDNSNDISVFKILISFFLGLIIFFVVDFLTALLLTLLFSFMSMIPIIKNIVSFIFMIRGDGPDFFIIFISFLISIETTNKFIYFFNKNNPLHPPKIKFGLGIALILFGLISIIVSIKYSTTLIGSVFLLLTGFYEFSSSKKKK